MRLVEFEDSFDTEGTVEDVIIYMRNDPIIYRKSLFPAIMKMKDLHDSKKHIDPNKCLGQAVGSAMESYCDQFQLGSLNRVFKKDDKRAIVDKLFAEELTQIRNGAY